MKHGSLIAAIIAVAILGTWAGTAFTSYFFILFVPHPFEYTSNLISSTFDRHERRQPFTIAFAGDIMLDRQIREFHADTGYDVFSADILAILHNVDAAVANLEGPVTTYPSTSLGSIPRSPENFSFTFDPKSLESLSAANIDTVSMGNNHIRDRGPDGIVQTKYFLDAAGVARFGSPEGDGFTATISVASTTVGLIAYNQFFPPESDEAFLAEVSALASTTEFTVVYPHWGNEYELVPTERQQQLAHAFIDAGADAVVGSHPHVIQTFETYDNHAIAYSLGNFIFDQYFTEDVRNGVILVFELDPMSRTYQAYPRCTYIGKDGVTSAKECSDTITSSAWMIGEY